MLNLSLPKVKLLRLETSDEGTFGKLYAQAKSWYSGELPWLDNAPGKSCIPVGTYECHYTYSPSFKRNLYLVGGVSSRSGIRIHPANFMGTSPLRCDLLGCIALGTRFGTMDGQKALILSTPALTEFELTMEYKPFLLEITNVWTSR